MRKRRPRSAITALFDLLFLSRILIDIPVLAVLRFFHQRNDEDYILRAGFYPLVSIVVPTYDRSDLLIERTLPALKAQTYPNIEIIVVGDGCSILDATKLEAASKLHGFRFYNLRKRGIYPKDKLKRWFVAGSVPLNKALDIAKGKWIAYCDDDDIFTSDHIQSLLSYACQNDIEFMSAAYRVVDSEGSLVKDWFAGDTPERVGGHSTWLYRDYLRWFKYSRFSFLKSWNRPTDIDRALRLRTAGVRMKYFDQIVTIIKPRPGATSIGHLQALVD